MCDDLFEDSDTEEVILEKSWKKTIDYINTEGYREGVDAGKEESVQSGFNNAFAVATKVLFQVAKLRGNISGQLSRNFLQPGSLHSDTECELQTLLQDVCALEGELLQYEQDQVTMCKHVINTDIKHSDQDTLKNSPDMCSESDNRGRTDKETRSSGADSGMTDSNVICDPDSTPQTDKVDSTVLAKVEKLKYRYKSIIDDGAR